MRRSVFLTLGLVVLLTCVFVVISAVHVRGSGPAPAQPTSSSRNGTAVGCLGRIEPLDGVLKIQGSYLNGRPQSVRELKVKEGDEVRAGQLVAVLDGKDQLTAAVRVADARVDLARTRLQQVQAGANPADIAAQRAVVTELQANLANARDEYERYVRLEKTTDVSTSELNARALMVTSAEQKLRQANERLNSISQVRDTDVDVAKSELTVAQAEDARARADLKTTSVYAPAAGRVLKIYAYRGEEPGPEGLLDLGRTDAMYVTAEVYETDINRVHAGQHAIVRSELLPREMTGVVETVGTVLSKNSVLPLDPVTFADARVFRVRIRLDDGKDAAALINGKVNVTIQP